MNESQFRIIMGSALIATLYFNLEIMLLALIALMAFEAITNYRIPMLVSKLRYGKQQALDGNLSGDCGIVVSRFNIEAERMMRVVVIAIIIPSYFIYPAYIWFLPWFVAFALIGAGLSGVCPSVILLKRLGFR